MAACQTVQKVMTENVLVPVEEVITEAKEVCEKIDEWFEEQVEQPVHKQSSHAQEQCSDWPWPVDWLCKTVMVIVTIIVWVFVTVGKWVAKIICQTVTFVVGTIVSFAMKVVSWLVSFVVCLFTDIDAAVKSFRDLWTILLDAAGASLDFADTLLADVEGILTDVENLIDTLANAAGWPGLPLGLLKGAIQLARLLTGAGRDALGGAKDLSLGILSGNSCRIFRGLAEIGVAAGRGIIGGGLVLGTPIGGLRDEYDQKILEETIRVSLDAAFGDDRDRIRRSIEKIGLRVRPMGLPFNVRMKRMFLDSENPRLNPKTLHDAAVIDLYRLAGHRSDCRNKFNEPDAEVVYRGTEMRVTYADLDAYLEGGPGTVTPFRVYPITRAKLRMHTDIAKRKMQSLGILLSFDFGEVEAFSTDHLPFNVHEAEDNIPREDKAQQELFTSIDGRDASGNGLAEIPAVSHFHYIVFKDEELFGFTTWFRPSSDPEKDDRRVSGVTHRNRAPDWGFRFVPTHELGHYLGLSHDNINGEERGLDEIMYTPKSDVKITASTVLEYMFLSGEPRFTSNDARVVWRWITSPVVRDILLP